MRRCFAPFVLLAALFAAGCGQSNPELIPQSNADALTATADKIQAACDDADRTAARREIRNSQREIDALPSRVSADLRKNLQDWVSQMQDRLADDCKDASEDEPTETPTPTETATETETAAPTETATETATQAPTETATEAPTDTATPAPTDTPAPTEPPAEPTTTPEAPDVP